MKINIRLTKNEERVLDALIELMSSFGLQKQFFTTGDQEFLKVNEHIIREVFTPNEIIEWFPEGCGQVKFKFTKLGLGLIKAHRPNFFEKLKPFLPFQSPSINPGHLPEVNVRLIKEKAVA